MPFPLKVPNEIKQLEPAQFNSNPLHGYTLGGTLEARCKATDRSYIGVGLLMNTSRYFGQFKALPTQYGKFIQLDNVGPGYRG